MKKIILALSIFLFILTGCKSNEPFLTSPNYDEFGFWGTEPPYVTENEKYAVISTLNSFFIYDKNQKKITHAYGIDVDKTFLPGFYLSESLINPDNSTIILHAEKDPFLGFDDYHYVYDIEKDEFTKKTGEIDFGKSHDYDERYTPARYGYYNSVRYDVGIMSYDLNTIYFISNMNGEKIYPFRDNFNKEDFEVK